MTEVECPECGEKFDAQNHLVRRECVNGVPITHAKNNVRGLFLKINGFKVKDDVDTEKFREQLDKIMKIPLGNKWNITKIRQSGSFGYELRVASYMAVCMGKAKINWVPQKQRGNAKLVEHAEFERIDGPKCLYFNSGGVIYKECRKCKRKFENVDIGYCPTCKYVRGNKKGQSYELGDRTLKELCNYSKDEFKPRKARER